ncbi:hypothetical protein [uncultured Streptomyces sp.]|nr:hypothetical protein [uncultured Streptomyces sp.]
MTDEGSLLVALIVLGLAVGGWIAVGWAADRRLTHTHLHRKGGTR